MQIESTICVLLQIKKPLNWKTYYNIIQLSLQAYLFVSVSYALLLITPQWLYSKSKFLHLIKYFSFWGETGIFALKIPTLVKKPRQYHGLYINILTSNSFVIIDSYMIVGNHANHSIFAVFWNPIVFSTCLKIINISARRRLTSIVVLTNVFKNCRRSIVPNPARKSTFVYVFGKG